MKSINYIVSIVLIMFLFSGCSESFLEEQPSNIITAESLYKDLEGFETGLNGLYALVRMEREGRSKIDDETGLFEDTDRSNNALRAEMFMNGTDVTCVNHQAGGEWSDVLENMNNLNNALNVDIQANFEWLYTTINAANTIITRAEESDIDWTGDGKSEDENKNRVVAEARAIRAWAYRHLTYTWGDVPLSLEESVGSNIKTDWERTSVEEVREQMKKDWLFAEQYIEVDCGIDGRLTKGAVQHYLAELYIVLENYDSAIYMANECINTPEYQLVTERYGDLEEDGVPFSDMFKEGKTNRNEGNTEALWTFQWEYNVVGGEGSNMRRYIISRYDEISERGTTALQLTTDRGGRGRARMASTKYGIDLYEPQDDRFSNYIFRRYYILKDETDNAPFEADDLPSGYSYGDTVFCSWVYPLTETDDDGLMPGNDRVDWPFSRKFEGGYDDYISDAYQYNDQVYLRLANTYLLLAEAQYLSGDPSSAAITLNDIRQRSNASTISAADVDMDFILEERARELMLEEHRRHTLVRTHTWYERTMEYNLNGGQNIQPHFNLLPIPQSVIDANLTLDMVQNPGYD